MSVPNQNKVKIGSRPKRNKDNLYAMMNLDALRQAMSDLKGSSLKMWLYFNKNQDGYAFELSRKDCESWGIKKDSYYSGLQDLIDKRFLVQEREGSNLYIFYEVPLSENQTGADSNSAKWFGENQKSYSGKANGLSEKPERNNISNTDILQNKTMATDKDNQRTQTQADCLKYKEYKERLGF